MEPAEDADQPFDECSSDWSDFDEHVIGPEQFTDQDPNDQDENDAAHDPDHDHESAEASANDQAAGSQQQAQEVFHDCREEDWPAEEEDEPVLRRPRRRRWRPRRDPLGMSRFACMILLPVLCAMAAA